MMSSKSAGKQENGVVTLITFLSFNLASAHQFPAAAEPPTTWVNNYQNLSASFRYLLPMLLSGQPEADASQSKLSGQLGDFRTVWSANRDNPVKANATLQLTSTDGLVLKDVDGKVAWSTNIPDGNRVASLNMAENGNLMLLDAQSSVVWQTFDHPTDTLVRGQYLDPPQKLTTISTDASEGNPYAIQFQYSMSVTQDGLSFAVETNPPQLYFEQRAISPISIREEYFGFNISVLLLQLRTDGHLRLYEHQKLDTDDRGSWKEILDVLGLGGCSYPTVCGNYGICTGDRQCSCPISVDYFRPISNYKLNQGCVPITPLTCNASEFHTFVVVENVSFYYNMTSSIGYIEMARCKHICLRNCSCKAAIIGNNISYSSNSSEGYCYLLTELLTLEKDNMTIDVFKYQGSAFIKVQNNPSTSGTDHNNHLGVIMGASFGGTILIVLIAAIYFMIKKRQQDVVNEDDQLDHVLGMLSRFSYDELIVATANFTTKLGQGGFGSVFEGVLKDGSKIAVKRLDGVGQVNKSFLAEVESIGNIHHVNLVRLVGFCADKSHKLLVYEYMTKGSLDNWIYDNSQNVILDWKCRRKIIQDVAKGLEYLHEDCRQRILHLDVKPQNILLDESFNAKLSDFGLAKLIDRDQSKVVTTMRGTPGYLAPEWLSGGVTEKVDVYSFGVVVLEILCGRKHFKESEAEEARHLLRLFKAKAEEGKLVDLVDSRSEDMLSHSYEVVEIMQIAAWCLVSDSSRRPSMSMVSKILEGVIGIEGVLDHTILNTTFKEDELQLRDCTTLLHSVLTGPR